MYVQIYKIVSKSYLILYDTKKQFLICISYLSIQGMT